VHGGQNKIERGNLSIEEMLTGSILGVPPRTGSVLSRESRDLTSRDNELVPTGGEVRNFGHPKPFSADVLGRHVPRWYFI